MYELIRDEALEGELLDAEQDCDGGFNACTNTDVELVVDPYMSDVYNTTEMRWLCPACIEQLCLEI